MQQTNPNWLALMDKDTGWDNSAREWIHNSRKKFNETHQNETSVEDHRHRTSLGSYRRELGLGDKKMTDLTRHEKINLKTSWDADISRERILRREREKQYQEDMRKFESNLKKGAIIAAISLVTAIGGIRAYSKSDMAKLRALKKETRKVTADMKAGKITEQQAQAKLKAIQKQVDTINARSKKAMNNTDN